MGLRITQSFFCETEDKKKGKSIVVPEIKYRGADKSLARPGRKQANVSVRMAWISLSCRGKQLDISRLDVTEIARVPYMLPSLFPS